MKLGIGRVSLRTGEAVTALKNASWRSNSFSAKFGVRDVSQD